MRSAFHFLCLAGRGLGLLLALGLTPAARVRAQTPEATHCLLLPIEPASRARQATLVVEAEVLDAHSFWDAAHRRIFTRHRLRVFSLLKGIPADTTGLQLITEGGQVGLDQQVLTNTLQLRGGQQGIFFLMPAPWPGAGPAAVAPVASQQGFIEFNPAEGTAAEPFRTYPALDAAFYQEISALTGQPRRVLRPNPALLPAAAQPARRGTLASVISSLAPLVLAGGTGAVLTIEGDGFGGSRGSGFVEFKNADDGGATRVKARQADYVAWTNTRIQVRVPSSTDGGHPAGSGLVRVSPAGQPAVESAGPVTISYSLTNVENTTGTLLQRPNHVALNATGGITFRFGPNFMGNAPAAAAWQRALVTWRCQTGINWEVGSTNPTNTIADDGQNVIAFDQGAELPDRVLGRTISYYRGCFAPSGELVFWVKEVDMQFDDATVFQFGPALPVSPQLDFESVVVHELGHAQQLAHLILRGAVMHYAIPPGQSSRLLNPTSDVAGGRQVLRGRSFRNLGCGGPALLPAPLTALTARYDAATGTTLSWATRDECFLSGFVVERSLSGDTSRWEPLATVSPQPGPGSQYQFTDPNPRLGLLYYRLRLRRPDGSIDSAAPRVLTTEGANASVSIFPNPVAEDFLRLQYPAPADGVVVFRIYDAVGRLVRISSQFTTAGLNVVSLSVTGLTPGFFVLHWRDAQGRNGQRRFVRI